MAVETDYPKLLRQPLTLVLAEFRFAPLALDGEQVNAFGALLGPAFPALREAVTQQVQVTAGSVNTTLVPVYQGVDAASGRYLHMDSGRVIYATTQYPRFEGFSAACGSILDAVHEVLAPRELLRVGLRYNDAVVPDLDEALADYLKPPLQPPTEPVPGGFGFVRHVAETVLQTAQGFLVVRALVGRHGLRTMPDLEGQVGLPVEGEIPVDRVTAVLDFDHYWQRAEPGTEAFSPVEAMQRLAALHVPARAAFWEMTTDFARRERWN
jgi:uncharacterized protein (TIGR04255 family)